MKIQFSCPFCQKSYSVDASLAGRKGRCKDCGSVMPIPAASEAGPKPAAARPVAARSASPSGATSSPTKPKSKPRPAPALDPTPRGDVDDPYGLADEPAPAPPMTIRPDMLADAEGGGPPLPRGGGGKSGTGKKKKKKRGVDEGAWGVPIRNAAIGLMGIVLTLGSVSKYIRRANLGDSVGTYLANGILAMNLTAAALCTVSIVGAIVSYSRGNRTAFRADNTGGFVAWGLSSLVSMLVAFFFFTGFLGFSWSRMAALDASLSATEMAPLAVYEDMVGTTIQYQQRMAAVLESLGNSQAGGGIDALMELSMLQNEAMMLDARSRSTPPPTRDQASQLFARYAGPFGEALGRYARAAREAAGRLAVPPDSPPGKSMREAADKATQYEQSYRQAFPEGSTDPTGWYFAVFSKDAGRGFAPGPGSGPMPPSSNAPAGPAPG